MKRLHDQEIKHFKEMDRIKLPCEMDYNDVPGISHEIREKLKQTRPLTLGQASRIPGMTPAGLSTLMVLLKAKAQKRKEITGPVSLKDD